jgi:hypothetical protein
MAVPADPALVVGTAARAAAWAVVPAAVDTGAIDPRPRGKGDGSPLDLSRLRGHVNRPDHEGLLLASDADHDSMSSMCDAGPA